MRLENEGYSSQDQCPSNPKEAGRFLSRRPSAPPLVPPVSWPLHPLLARALCSSVLPIRGAL